MRNKYDLSKFVICRIFSEKSLLTYNTYQLVSMGSRLEFFLSPFHDINVVAFPQGKKTSDDVLN